MNRARSLVSKTALALGQAGLIALLIVGLVASTALAAKGGAGGKPGGGGGGTGGSGNLAVVMVTDVNGDGLPNWGDQVTFNVSTTATDRPTVRLHCSQNGTLVYTATAGFFAGYPWTTVYSLSSQSWTGGAASCTASLIYSGNNGRINTVATLNVAVGG